MAWWLMPPTPDPEVGSSSPTRVKPCCVLEQGTFTPQKVLVIPRKRWLLPNMTEKLFTGTLRIKSTNQVRFLGLAHSFTSCQLLVKGCIKMNSDKNCDSDIFLFLFKIIEMVLMSTHNLCIEQ